MTLDDVSVNYTSVLDSSGQDLDPMSSSQRKISDIIIVTFYSADIRDFGNKKGQASKPNLAGQVS